VRNLSSCPLIRLAPLTMPLRRMVSCIHSACRVSGTFNLSAIPVSVSPGLTRYVRAGSWVGVELGGPSLGPTSATATLTVGLIGARASGSDGVWMGATFGEEVKARKPTSKRAPNVISITANMLEFRT